MSEFPDTRWSLLVRAQDGSMTISRRALTELLELYSPCLRAHLIFDRRLQQSDADDLLHDFIHDKILERDLLSNANPERGKFRSFLLTSLRHFLIDQVRRNRRLGQVLQIDEEIDGELAAPQSSVFDVAWARQVLLESLKRLQQTCDETIWKVFCYRVLSPAIDGNEITYEEIIDRCDVKDARQASNRLMTAKRQFDRVFNDAIAQYGNHDAGSIKEEIDHFKHVLANNPVLNCDDFAKFLESSEPESSQELSAIMTADSFSLARILDRSKPNSWSDEDLRTFLESQLETRLHDISHHGHECSEQQIGDLLLDEQPSLSALQQLLRYAKIQVHSERSEVPQEVGSALYFSAIAVAHLRHQRLISDVPTNKLITGIAAFANRAWVPVPLQDVLQAGKESLASCH